MISHTTIDIQKYGREIVQFVWLKTSIFPQLKTVNGKDEVNYTSPPRRNLIIIPSTVTKNL